MAEGKSVRSFASRLPFSTSGAPYIGVLPLLTALGVVHANLDSKFLLEPKSVDTACESLRMVRDSNSWRAS